MSLIDAGGWVMLPLLIISVIVLALIIDRFLTYSRNPMPNSAERLRILEDLKKGAVEQAAEALGENTWLSGFSDALRSQTQGARFEGNLNDALEDIREYLGKRLALLATLGRISPLLGLLGTVIGMIQTFAVIAHSKSGIDMELLADGIWQALITTATGLIIAIPAVLFYRIFLSALASRLNYLSKLANAAIALKA